MTEAIARAGLVRRFGALAIDLILAAVVVQAVAAIAYPLTDGRIQAMGGGIQVEECRPIAQLPPGLTLPTDFRVDKLDACVQRFLAFPTSGILRAREVTRDGSVTRTRTMTWSVDPEGRIVAATRLDAAAWLLLILLRVLLDAKARSPGRRLCQQRVVPIRDAEDAGLATGRVRRRYAYFALPIMPAFLLDLVSPITGGMSGFTATVAFALNGLTICAVVAAAAAIAFGRDTFYDRAAATSVVRA